MNTPPRHTWDQLRAAYRPAAPALDTAAIMDAVRQEAFWGALRRAPAGLAAGVPLWFCAAAASLALLAAAGALGSSIRMADQSISDAWCQSVPPEEFERSFMNAEELAL